jgi:hypothetical protein
MKYYIQLVTLIILLAVACVGMHAESNRCLQLKELIDQNIGLQIDLQIHERQLEGLNQKLETYKRDLEYYKKELEKLGANLPLDFDV